MSLSYDELSQKLRNKDIRPSHQRIKLLEYLVKNPHHPTVDQIFTDLKEHMPTLSRSTVYNTMHLFLLSGLVRLVSFEDQAARYDVVTDRHGHFQCERCGCVFNLNIDLDDLPVNEPAGCQITERNLYFRGICARCL